jgi:uncharacterized FAD-dependent dehydrogenase
MTVRVNNIKIGLDDDLERVRELAAKSARLNVKDIRNFKILKESIDARKKESIVLVYHVEYDCDNEKKVVSRASSNDVKLEEPYNEETLIFGSEEIKYNPIVVGSGPAGLFAGLVMAKNGYKPIILERGGDVDSRHNCINKFWETGELDTDCNVQFGE